MQRFRFQFFQDYDGPDHVIAFRLFVHLAYLTDSTDSTHLTVAARSRYVHPWLIP